MPQDPGLSRPRWRMFRGRCERALRGETPQLRPESVDAVVCDPPYGLRFMGKAWDHGVPSVHIWQRIRDCMKPGAYLLAFGGTRTYHRLASAIEDAGFEVRDCMMWLYGQGFPKSARVDRALTKAKRSDMAPRWIGWGTALKPSWEPIIVARKPLAGTVAANVLMYGTGALNIDACRIGTDGGTRKGGAQKFGWDGSHSGASVDVEQIDAGRWPANVALDDEAARLLDEQSGVSTSNDPGTTHVNDPFFGLKGERRNAGYEGDSGGASRFFYTAKASRSEREAGLHEAAGEANPRFQSRFCLKCGKNVRAPGACGCKGAGIRWAAPPRAVRNTHPTVKPVKLMQYLLRLVARPGAVVWDPFAGSGSTLVAGVSLYPELPLRMIGHEDDKPSFRIAVRRIRHHARLAAAKKRPVKIPPVPPP